MFGSRSIRCGANGGGTGDRVDRGGCPGAGGDLDGVAVKEEAVMTDEQEKTLALIKRSASRLERFMETGSPKLFVYRECMILSKAAADFGLLASRTKMEADEAEEVAK